MQTFLPPIRFTGSPVVDWTVIILAAGGALYVLKAIRLSRDTLRPMLGLFIVGYLFGLVYYQVRGQSGGDTPMKDGVFLGIVAALFLRSKRTRNYSRKLKREVIERDFKGKVHEYDPKKHHVDHKWPFALGGSHTSDNLRVLDRSKNLKKGAKKPGFWDMFFR